MAIDQEQRDQEVDAGTHPVSVPTTKQKRRAFNNVRRELSEEELSSPGARRLLLDNVDRLEDEVESLRHFQDDFYRAQVEVTTLRERLKASIAADVMYGVSCAVGFGLLGIVGNIWEKRPYAVIVLAVSVLLVIGGVAVKVIKR